MQEYYDFEWDETKNLSNGEKHGVTLADARAIWDDPLFVEAHLSSAPEDRWVAIGRISKSRYLTAIFTYRGERVRLISARESTKKEVGFYGRR